MFARLSNSFDALKQTVFIPLKSIFTANQRRLLIFLMGMLGLFSMAQTGFAIYLSTLFYDKATSSINLGSNIVLIWVGLAIIGLCLMITCTVGIRGAQTINLELLLTFFWSIMVFIAPLIVTVIGCLNFYQYINMFFTHEWELSGFAGPRSLFCRPKETADNKCIAPRNGGSRYISTTAWCFALFNATDCADIREAAIKRGLNWGSKIILIVSSVAVINLCIILFTLFICYRILTAPVITESMNDIINYLLLVPIGGCVGMGVYMSDWLHYQSLPYFWSTKTFFSAAGCQAFALPLGVFAGRMKSQLMLASYLVIMTMIVVVLVVLGAYGLLYAGLIPHTFKPDVSELSHIACSKALPGCCCCNNTALPNRCPEWSEPDIISLLVLDLKLSGTVAFISVMYLLGAQFVAWVVRDGLKNYKTDSF